MAERGSYAKGIVKRDEILRTALEVFSRQGARGSSLRDLADAAGLSQAGLLHYFGSKEALFAEILRTRDDLDDAAYRDRGTAVKTMVAILRHNAEVPGLVALYAMTSAAATETEHPAHDFFVTRYERMRSTVAESIRSMQAAGQLDSSFDPARLSTILIAVADGMQLQWLLDSEQQMATHLEYLWSMLTESPAGRES